MEQANFEFPQLIKDIVKGLDNEIRWKILEHLINNGNMSYSQLLKGLKIENKGSLNFHLGVLSKSAIIERYENLSDKTGNKSFYDISPIGKDVVNGLLGSLAPVARPIAVFDPDLIKNSATIVGADYVNSPEFFYPLIGQASAAAPNNIPVEAAAVAS